MFPCIVVSNDSILFPELVAMVRSVVEYVNAGVGKGLLGVGLVTPETQ